MPTDPISLTRPKYGNSITEVDGWTFQSRAEATRYGELKLMVKAGIITDLAVHPTWDLPVNGMIVARYVADFCYWDVETGRLTVEDVKSEPTKTPVYRLKKKLMLAIHGLTIQEIGT